MKPVTQLMEKTNEFLAHCIAMGNVSLRRTPLIRCENCTKTPEEAGPKARSMMCSSCKTKLDFIIHYCSQKCQREDWKAHKINCGKKSVSKGLPGTESDPFWMCYTPATDFIHHLKVDANGRIDIREVGIASAQYDRPEVLESQVSMLEKDQDADYFLFNDQGESVPFTIEDKVVQMHFRILRPTAMSSADREGFEAIAEYGEDARTKIDSFEKESACRFKGLTFLESSMQSMDKAFPKV